mmetsp:Transcript_12556/g.41162  ORF Transcript_12556/g.41162 Transcript_12556/m.41162 type:complete len:214 (-) Transcript_12556:496-1137(-)
MHTWCQGSGGPSSSCSWPGDSRSSRLGRCTMRLTSSLLTPVQTKAGAPTSPLMGMLRVVRRMAARASFDRAPASADAASGLARVAPRQEFSWRWSRQTLRWRWSRQHRRAPKIWRQETSRLRLMRRLRRQCLDSLGIMRAPSLPRLRRSPSLGATSTVQRSALPSAGAPCSPCLPASRCGLAFGTWWTSTSCPASLLAARASRAESARSSSWV